MCAFSASVVAFLSCVQIVMRQICVGFPFNFQQLFFVDVCGSLTNRKMVPLGCQFRRLFSLLLRPLSSVSLSFVLCRKEITRSETYKTTNSRRLSALEGGRNMRCWKVVEKSWFLCEIRWSVKLLLEKSPSRPCRSERNSFLIPNNKNIHNYRMYYWDWNSFPQLCFLPLTPLWHKRQRFTTIAFTKVLINVHNLIHFDESLLFIYFVRYRSL